MPMAAAALPILWACAFVSLMIGRFAPATGISQKYFFGLVGGTIAVFGVLTWLVKKYAPGARWTAQVCFFGAGFVLLTDHHYPVSDNYDQLLWLGFEFPRYFVGELGVGLALLLGVGVFARMLPQSSPRSFIWLAVCNTVTLPVQIPPEKLPDTAGETDTGVVPPGNGRVRPELAWSA